ncbi:MAG: MotA/TolQ/ExbB proton channel family protein [Phycisphaerales bacterium]|nr:MotA/TolQ/ExbB proton channel family protein [Planctomycetota bacterium]
MNLMSESFAVLGQQTQPGLVSTVLEMVLKGGWSMVPLGVCSLVALALVVERWILTRPGRIAPPPFMASIAALRASPSRLLAACDADKSPVACVIAEGVRARDGSPDEIEKRLAEAGQRQVLKLRHRMRLISVLPQVATMLGLLGTVVGMIRTFTVVAASAESLGKTEKLAQGIYEAWTATAAGLIIAIPTLLAYHILMGRIDAAAAALDAAATQWLRPSGVEAPSTRESVEGELALAEG